MKRHPHTTTVEPTEVAVTPTSGWLALGAVVGSVMFTLTWLVLGFLATGYTLFGTWIPYSPVTQPISGLGLGSTGPVMNAAFILGGLLLAAGVIGFFRVLAANGRPAGYVTALTLMLLSPLGMVVDGFFTFEAMMVHLLGFMLAIGTPVVSFLVTGRLLRKLPEWRRLGNWLLVASPVTLVLLVVFFMTFDPIAAGEGIGVGGLTQRLLGVEVLFWFVTMGWLAYRRASHVTEARREHQETPSAAAPAKSLELTRAGR